MNSEYLNDPRNFIYVAERLNNAKRRHLYVNALQAKHIPVKGEDALALFDKLADELSEKTAGEKLLIIGFAETATAIGARLAEKAGNGGYFVTTTREYNPKDGYIEFSESHSHAQTQLLNIRGLDEAINNTDRIVFAEDEITTGGTIEKLVNKLKERRPDKKLKFGVASVLSSLGKGRGRELDELGVMRAYLYKIPQNCTELKNGFISNGQSGGTEASETPRININYINSPYLNQREASLISEYSRAVGLFTEEVLSKIELSEKDKDVLVLGTEEFMYPAIRSAAKLSGIYPEKNIVTHSTTRSPISVRESPGYPLKSRIPVISLYEDGRRNFLYNLKRYDKIIVLTDASPERGEAFAGFARSLGTAHAAEVEFNVWREK